MFVVSATESRTTTTPSATMVALAGPSQGSVEVSTWRVDLPADRESPMHTITREQIWMPISGSVEFTIDGETATVSAGQALIVPADTARQFRTTTRPAQALVAMVVDGKATVPGSADPIPLPWAK